MGGPGRGRRSAKGDGTVSTCHCGQPQVWHGYDQYSWTRNLCEHCDSVRCDAYPGSCKPDAINNPDHYKWLPVEAIEITEHFNFVLGNVLKYVMRADRKGRPLEDLKKARWYLDREIQKRELASE